MKRCPFDTAFLPTPCGALPEDELVSIIDKSKKPDWEVKMLEQGAAPQSFSAVAEIETFFKQLHRVDKHSAKR